MWHISPMLWSMMKSCTCYKKTAPPWIDPTPLSKSFSWTSPAPSTPSKPRLLRAKLENMQVESPLITWVDDYLTGRPSLWDYKTVRLTIWSASLAPSKELCCLPSSSPPTLQYHTESRHLQKFSDDTAIVGLVGREDEYRVVGNFVKWCEENHNITKTKEMVLGLRRNYPGLSSLHWWDRRWHCEFIHIYIYIYIYIYIWE